MILTLFGYGPGVFWRSYSSLVAELLIWKEFPSIAGRINFNVWPNFGLWKAALRSTTALAAKSASLKVTADNMLSSCFLWELSFSAHGHPPWRSYSSLVAELLIWKEFPSIAGRINFNVWPNFGLWKAALRSTTALAAKSASLKVTADNIYILYIYMNKLLLLLLLVVVVVVVALKMHDSQATFGSRCFTKYVIFRFPT